jgi:hypothetical protein
MSELPCEDCTNPAELNRVRCAGCLAKRRVIEARIRARNGQAVGNPGRPRRANAKPESVRARKYYQERRDTAGMEKWAEALIRRLAELGHSDELGETWMDATARRYREHEAACAALGCQQIQESFEVFAREIVEAPTNAVRLSILAPMEMAEAPEPFREYQQYRSPIAAAA